MKKPAVILVSGGLDSITVVAMAKDEGFDPRPISFFYNQRHQIELLKAEESLKLMGITNHKIVNIDLSSFGGSALTDKNINVPKYSSSGEIGSNIPITYVPARNTIFLSFALGYAEVIGANDIFIGAHEQDSANYPDCRKEFIKAYEEMANKAVASVEGGKNRINIQAPLINMNKSEIVKKGLELGVDYSKTISCYDATDDGLSCGSCHACLVRIDAFKENNMEDPAPYTNHTLK